MMNKREFLSFGLPVGVIAVFTFGGCSDDTEGSTPPCNWVYNIAECPDPPEADNAEVGDGDGDPPAQGGMLSDACEVADGTRPRTVFQCDGSFVASIAFNTVLGDCGQTLGDPGWCDEEHEFGLGFEPYSRPAAMACCDADGTPDDELLRMCSVDMVEQICLSIPARIQSLISGGAIKVGKNQAKALRDWLQTHQQDCYDALNQQSEEPGALERATWLVNGGNNKNWKMLKNFRVTLDDAVITSATLPEHEDDYIECWDNDFNNTEVFEKRVPLTPGRNSVTRLADAGEASIGGPVLTSGRVIGRASLASRARGCWEPSCSTMLITTDADGITLDELTLFADTPVVMSYATLAFEIDRAAVRLYGVSHGHRVDGRYMIDRGDAHFLISGSSGNVAGFRWATNSTAIVIEASASGWQLDSFGLVHVDGKGQVWTVSVPETTWD